MPFSWGHAKYCLQWKWQQKDIRPYFINHSIAWGCLACLYMISPQVIAGIHKHPSGYCLWFLRLVTWAYQQYFLMSNKFKCRHSLQFNLWQVEQYNFTNNSLSCPPGVFGAVFQSPPSQQLILRGPVAWPVRIIVVSTHSLQGTWLNTLQWTMCLRARTLYCLCAFSFSVSFATFHWDTATFSVCHALFLTLSLSFCTAVLFLSGFGWLI